MGEFGVPCDNCSPGSRTYPLPNGDTIICPPGTIFQDGGCPGAQIVQAGDLGNCFNYVLANPCGTVPQLAAANNPTPVKQSCTTASGNPISCKVLACVKSANEAYNNANAQNLATTYQDMKPDFKWFATFGIGRLLALGGKFSLATAAEALVIGAEAKGIYALGHGAYQDMMNAGALQYRLQLCEQDQ